MPFCFLLGALSTISFSGHGVPFGSRHSALSVIGRTVTPVFSPMGVTDDNWPATVGLATGVLAKEVVIGTLDALYAGNQPVHLGAFHFKSALLAAWETIPDHFSRLVSAMRNPFAASQAPTLMSKYAYGQMFLHFHGQAAALAYLLFVLLYFPCISTLAVMRKEIGRSWAYFSVVWSTAIAYGLAVILFQSLTFSLHPFGATAWIVGLLLLLCSAILFMRVYARRAE